MQKSKTRPRTHATASVCEHMPFKRLNLLHLHSNKFLFLLVGFTISGSESVPFRTVLTSSLFDAASLIEFSSSSRLCASAKIFDLTSSDTISFGIFSSLCEIGIFRRDSLTSDLSMRGLFSDDGVAISAFSCSFSFSLFICDVRLLSFGTDSLGTAS